LTPRPMPQSARTRFSFGVRWAEDSWRRERIVVRRRRRRMSLGLKAAILRFDRVKRLTDGFAVRRGLGFSLTFIDQRRCRDERRDTGGAVNANRLRAYILTRGSSKDVAYARNCSNLVFLQPSLQAIMGCCIGVYTDFLSTILDCYKIMPLLLGYW